MKKPQKKRLPDLVDVSTEYRLAIYKERQDKIQIRNQAIDECLKYMISLLEGLKEDNNPMYPLNNKYAMGRYHTIKRHNQHVEAAIKKIKEK